MHLSPSYIDVVMGIAVHVKFSNVLLQRVFIRKLDLINCLKPLQKLKASIWMQCKVS